MCRQENNSSPSDMRGQLPFRGNGTFLCHCIVAMKLGGKMEDKNVSSWIPFLLISTHTSKLIFHTAITQLTSTRTAINLWRWYNGAENDTLGIKLLWQISSAQYPQGQTIINDKTVVSCQHSSRKDTAYPARKLLLNKTYQQPRFHPNMLPANIFSFYMWVQGHMQELILGKRNRISFPSPIQNWQSPTDFN